jgi:hypothetical protein
MGLDKSACRQRLFRQCWRVFGYLAIRQGSCGFCGIVISTYCPGITAFIGWRGTLHIWPVGPA